MNPATPARLEFLIRCYQKVRRQTLRLLQNATAEELSWQPPGTALSVQAILARLVEDEERQIHYEARGKQAPRPAAAGPAPSVTQFRHRLTTMKRVTYRFLQQILDGRQSQSSGLLEDLENAILREAAASGQIELLRRLRQASLEAEPAPRIHPQRAATAAAPEQPRVAISARRKA